MERIRRGRSRDWEDKAKRAHSRLLSFLGERLSLEDIIAGNFYIGIPKDRVETPYIQTSMGGWGKSLYMGEDLIRVQADHYSKLRISSIQETRVIDTDQWNHTYLENPDYQKFYIQKVDPYWFKESPFGISVEDYLEDHYIYSTEHLEHIDVKYEKSGEINVEIIPLKEKLEELCKTIEHPYKPLPITRTETQMEFSVEDIQFRFEEFEIKDRGWSNYGGIYKGDCCYTGPGAMALGRAERLLKESGEPDYTINNYVKRYLADDGKVYMLQVKGADGKWYYTANNMYKGCLRTCGVHLFNAVKYGSCSSSQFPELDERGTFGTRIPNTGWSALTSYTEERLWRYYPTGQGHA